MANAATTYTRTKIPGTSMEVIEITWLCDDANGQPVDGVVPNVNGWIERVVILPGAGITYDNGTADFTIWDNDLVSVEGTALDNLANTAPIGWIPDLPIFVGGKMTVRVSANAYANSATYKMKLYVSK